MELSSLDIHVLIAELQILLNTKINKVYQPEPDTLLLQLHSASAGKRLLQLTAGKALLMLEEKSQTPVTPSGYCHQVRNLLEGTVIREITQLGFERIVRITCAAGGAERRLHLELFGKGNIIITDSNDIILSAMRIMAMRDRTVRPKERYVLPPSRTDPRQLSAAAFAKLLDAEQPVVKVLATTLGLGGTIAEELCVRASVDKKLASTALTAPQRQTLYTVLQELLSSPPAPQVVKEGDKLLVLPFAAQRYPAALQCPMPSMSAAVAEVLGSSLPASPAQQSRSAALAKLQNIFTLQSQQLPQLEREALDEQRKGELLYEHYAELKPLLAALQEAFKRKQLDQEAKQHASIRSVDPRRGTATIDIA